MRISTVNNALVGCPVKKKEENANNKYTENITSTNPMTK